jgi:hypothetical protein
LVYDAVQAVGRLRHHNIRTAAALICCIALLGGCGGSSSPKERAKDQSTKELPADLRAPGVGSVRQADCTDWKRGKVDQRRSTVVQLRKFAGGPVGSSAGIQKGPVLDDGRAYKVLQSYCSKYFARGFKLYKLYERAAAFVGH